MALLMLKTKDLSWQDHTVNVEVMLAPTKATLLSNKHKTLATKCDSMKRNFDKERDAVLKDIMIERRMMERKKQEIHRRQSEIFFKKALKEPSVASTKDSEISSKRLGSAPISNTRAPSGYSDYSNTSFFLTDLRHPDHHQSDGDGRISAYSEGPSGRNSAYSEANTMTSTNVSTRGSYLKSPYFAVPSQSRNTDAKRSSKAPPKSVRFQDSACADDNPSQLFSRVSDLSLEEKIKQFIRKQEDFNTKPLRRPVSEPVRRHEPPVVAKRYKSLKLDKLEIEKAFDAFCDRKNIDELHKLIKLSTKLKANVRMARNQSIMPSFAAFRAAKAFKANLNKAKSACWSCSVVCCLVCCLRVRLLAWILVLTYKLKGENSSNHNAPFPLLRIRDTNREEQCFGSHSPRVPLALLPIHLTFMSNYCAFFSIRGTDANVLNSSRNSCLSRKWGTIDNNVTRTRGEWTIMPEECAEKWPETLFFFLVFLSHYSLHSRQWTLGINEVMEFSSTGNRIEDIWCVKRFAYCLLNDPQVKLPRISL